MEVLQTSALPLGYAAPRSRRALSPAGSCAIIGDGLMGTQECVSSGGIGAGQEQGMERETGFEPATSTLARLHSTTELFPPITAGSRILTKRGKKLNHVLAGSAAVPAAKGVK